MNDKMYQFKRGFFLGLGALVAYGICSTIVGLIEVGFVLTGMGLVL